MGAVEIAWGSMVHVCDPGAGPEERAAAAEAAYLAAPPGRRGRTWTAALVGLNLTWGGDVVGYTPRDAAPCPACGGRPAGRCLVCSASPDDPAQWPMTDLKDRARILAGPLKGRVRKARTRRERRAARRADAPMVAPVNRADHSGEIGPRRHAGIPAITPGGGTKMILCVPLTIANALQIEAFSSNSK